MNSTKEIGVMDMNIILLNTDINPIYIEFRNEKVLLHPQESCSFTFDDHFKFKLKHITSDSNAPVMYWANVLLSYKRPRTELTIDGEYCFEPTVDNTLLKIKSHEYVFNKNISYHVFVFNCDSHYIKCTKYNVPKRSTIIRKCRVRYLFGGIKTLFPISLLLFAISLVGVLYKNNLYENALHLVGSGICAIAFGVSYLRDLHNLYYFSKETQIRKYMDSQRIEFRTLEDNIVEKFLNNASAEEIYW